MWLLKLVVGVRPLEGLHMLRERMRRRTLHILQPLDLAIVLWGGWRIAAVGTRCLVIIQLGRVDASLV
jgi:hypothetical protein